MLPSTSVVDSVSCLRYAECSRAPDYITNGYGSPMQTTSCTWPYVVPIGEDPAAHGHWCTFTDLYHTTIPPCTSHHTRGRTSTATGLRGCHRLLGGRLSLLLSPYFSLPPLHLLCLLVTLMGFPLKTCSHVTPGLLVAFAVFTAHGHRYRWTMARAPK